MPGGRLTLAFALVGTLLVHATAAYAAPGDPPIGSPARSAYVLPLEQGRSDAAPKTGLPGGGSGGTGGGSSGEAASLYRSENNFGSSSNVPGLAASGVGLGLALSGSSPGDGSDGGAGGGAASGGRPDGSNGGETAAEAGAVSAQAEDSGNASVAGSVALLVAIGLVAVAIGVLSARATRRTRTIAHESK